MSSADRHFHKGLAAGGLAFLMLWLPMRTDAFSVDDTNVPAIGQWCGNFAAVTNVAKAESRPVVMVWSKASCPYCEKLETVFEQASFEEWMAAQPYYFCFVRGDVSANDVGANAGSGARDFACTAGGTKSPVSTTPVVCLWHPHGDGKVTATSFTGQTGRMLVPAKGDDGVTMDLSAQFVGSVERFYAAYNNPFCFAASGTDFDRYEAEDETAFVDVEFVRKEGGAPFASECSLVVEWPADVVADSVATQKLEWAEGEAEKTVRVELAMGARTRFPAGESIRMALYDAGGVLLDTNAIHFVECENSNVNPLWIGERTSDTLEFGEWTMDIDVATNKVAAFGGDAYTLVSVQGALWCPDCANVDRNLMDVEDGSGSNRFRAWAAAKNVALVTVDIPNYNGPTVTNCASPSLLSRTAYDTAIARARELPDSGADPAFTNRMLRSGRAYLSRKMVSEAEARAIRERNHFLVSTNTAFGGFHRPEDSNKNRTGVPIFVLLRGDGTVAARLTRLASVSPMASACECWENYIARFDEMLELASSDAAEIDNNHWTTTTCSLSSGSLTTGTISHADTDDWFAISGAESRSPVHFGLSGESTNVVTLSVGSVVGETFKTVASATGPLKGLSLKTELPVAQKWFVGVSCKNSGEGFTVDSPVSTVAGYSLSALVSPPSQNPGEIAFAQSSVRIAEFAGRGAVRVERSGGNAGAASVRVVCVASDPAANGRYEWEDAVVTWADGESGARDIEFALVPNEVYEGVACFTVKIEKLDCPSFVSEEARCEVAIIDTDAPCMASGVYDVSAYMNFDSATAFPIVNIEAGDAQVSVVKTSGTIPAGMKMAYDRATGEVVLSGVPKNPGTYKFGCMVTVRRKGKRVAGFETEVVVTVADPVKANPHVAVKRSLQMIPLFATEGDGTRRLAGLANVAITSKGAISARYSGTEGKSISFSGRWQRLADGGTAFAELASKGATLSLAMAADGSLSLSLDLPGDYNWFAYSGCLESEPCLPSQDGSFDAFRGYYNIALPQLGVDGLAASPAGSGILSLTMTGNLSVKNGTMRFAGVLPDGSSVSGSAQIKNAGGEKAFIPVFSRTAQNVLGVSLEVGANGSAKWDRDILDREIVKAEDEVSPYVLHRESAWTWLSDHGAYGSYYVPGVSPAELESMFYDDASRFPPGMQFALTFDDAGAAASEMHGALAATHGLTVRAERKTMRMDAAPGHSFSFNSRTGVFRGVARLTFEDGKVMSGSYSGIVVPGWVLPCECGTVAPEMPFGCGMLCFRDVVGGKTVKRSLPVFLDK